MTLHPLRVVGAGLALRSTQTRVEHTPELLIWAGLI